MPDRTRRSRHLGIARRSSRRRSFRLARPRRFLFGVTRPPWVGYIGRGPAAYHLATAAPVASSCRRCQAEVEIEDDCSLSSGDRQTPSSGLRSTHDILR